MAVAQEDGRSISSQGAELPVLPEYGERTLKMLLQLPEEIGQIESTNLPADGYPVHILPDASGYLIVRKNIFYPRDSMDYPIAPNVTERESCLIPAVLLYEGLMKIQPGQTVTVQGKASYRDSEHKQGPIDYDYLNGDSSHEGEEAVTLIFSLSNDTHTATLTVGRGEYKDGEIDPYVRIERTNVVRRTKSKLGIFGRGFGDR